MAFIEGSRKAIMFFMLIMTAITVLVLFNSGKIGYAFISSSTAAPSLFQAIIAIVTIFSVFVIFSIVVHPPKDIDVEIRSDKVHQRTEIEFVDRFVKKARKNGYSDSQIKEGLIRHNWSEDLVDSCLAS